MLQTSGFDGIAHCPFTIEQDCMCAPDAEVERRPEQNAALATRANARFLFRFRGSGSTPWTVSSLALAQVRLISCDAARARDAQQPMRVFDIPAVKALGPGQHAQRVRDATGLHGSDRHFCAKSNEGLFQVCGSVECGWLCDGDGRWPSVVRHIAKGTLRPAGVTFTPNPRRFWPR